MSEDLSLKLVSLSLDAALMRHSAIAANIANQGNQNYQSQELNFTEQLQGLLDENLNIQPTKLAAIQPFYQDSSKLFPLDQQMALSLKNATQFKALIKGLNYKLAMMKLALHGVNQA